VVSAGLPATDVKIRDYPTGRVEFDAFLHRGRDFLRHINEPSPTIINFSVGSSHFDPSLILF
jgi:hypothetical protein